MTLIEKKLMTLIKKLITQKKTNDINRKKVITQKKLITLIEKKTNNIEKTNDIN